MIRLCEVCDAYDGTGMGWVRPCSCYECGGYHNMCASCIAIVRPRPREDVPVPQCVDRLRVALVLMGYA